MTTQFLSNEIELYATKTVNGGEEEVVTPVFAWSD
jgi:hypothetical protein